MGSLQYRKSKSLGKGTRLNISHKGVGVSKKVGRASVSSRGNVSYRVAPGVSYRGKGGSAAGVVAVVAVFGLLWAGLVLLARVLWWLAVQVGRLLILAVVVPVRMVRAREKPPAAPVRGHGATGGVEAEG